MHALVVLLCINQQTRNLKCLALPIRRYNRGKIKKKTHHVTLTTPIRGKFVIQRLAFDVFHLRTKFGDSRFSRSGDMTTGVEIENGFCDPDHALLG